MKILDERMNGKRYTDYYDGIAKQYFNKDVFFHRKQSTIETNSNIFKSFQPYSYYSENGLNLNFEIAIIGFCNQTFPCLIMLQTINDKQHKTFITDINIALATCQKYNLNNHFVKDMKQFFANAKQHKFDDIFINQKTPIFLVTYCNNRNCDIRIELNPILKDTGFESVYPPRQAYQAILQFMSNIAEERKPIPIIDNDNKILTHGFDKFSFRKPKSNPEKFPRKI
jgi:hypothetical protein